MASRTSGSVSLAELARECQVSVSHFARGFRRSTGVAPHRWLVEQKMEHAKQLLESTSFDDHCHRTGVWFFNIVALFQRLSRERLELIQPNGVERNKQGEGRRQCD
jgi:AraC-like DNA-binding protein